MGLDPESKKWLQKHLGAGVQFDEPMFRHTYFRVGGPADAFVKPKSLEALQKLINWDFVSANFAA